MHHIGTNPDGSYCHYVVGYIDYYSPDKISKLEINSMAKELGMGIENMSFRWMHPKKAGENGLRKLEDDNDTIEMSMFVGDTRVMHIYCSGNGYLNDELEEKNGENNDASHSELAGEKTDVRDRNEEKCDSDYNDSYYDLMGEEDKLYHIYAPYWHKS